MKRFLKFVLFLLLVLIVVIVFQSYPISSDAKKMPLLSDTNNIKRNLMAITGTSNCRNFENVSTLDTVADRIQVEFSKYTARVSTQTFPVNNKFYKNIIASFGPEQGERIIVGAHYDVCEDQQGADDNASGVAGVLELARLLRTEQLKYRIDLVAYSLEEPPYFGTENMGSYIHAKSLHDEKVSVKGMISLEMIGYFSDSPNSQSYPAGFLSWFYGNKGNYITVVQKPFDGGFPKIYKATAFETNSILTKSFLSPSFFGGIDLSDHRNYWKFGYSAVMITNTAFFRNRNYHTEGDKVSTLDIGRMGLVIDCVFRTLIKID